MRSSREHYVTHPSYLRMIARDIEAEGVDLHDLMACVGMSWAELSARERFLPFSFTRKFIHEIQKSVPRPTLSLDLALKVDASAHGVLSQFVVHSQNLRQAIEAVVYFFGLRTQMMALSVRKAQGGTYLQIQPLHDLMETKGFMLDHTAAYVSRLLSAMHGSTLSEARLELPWAKPTWADAYYRVAGQLKFRAQTMAFWFPDALLDRPCPSASKADFMAYWKAAQAALHSERATESTVAKVRREIEDADMKCGLSELEIAARLGMSRRNLVYRLKADQTSYRQILDSIKKKRAHWLLRHSHLTIAEVSQELGYSDAANFTRSFKKWFGESPNSYRLRH